MVSILSRIVFLLAIVAISFSFFANAAIGPTAPSYEIEVYNSDADGTSDDGLVYVFDVYAGWRPSFASSYTSLGMKKQPTEKKCAESCYKRFAAAFGSCDSYIYSKPKKTCSLFKGAWPASWSSGAPCLTWQKAAGVSAGSLYATDDEPDYSQHELTCA